MDQVSLPNGFLLGSFYGAHAGLSDNFHWKLNGTSPQNGLFHLHICDWLARGESLLTGSWMEEAGISVSHPSFCAAQ